MATTAKERKTTRSKALPEKAQKKITGHLADWLRDAYAMEHQAIEMLEREASRIQHYPELKEKIISYLEVSKKQAEDLKHCLKSLGEDTSMLKTGLAKMIGTAQALSGLMMSDEIIKVSVAFYIFQHYQIGNYSVLIEAAEDVGEKNIAKTCEIILREEEEMANWLADYLPYVTRKFLEREGGGKNGKR
ncbi:MAG: hypothetical protein K0R63_1231 [Rickettsiales bacterium]|nr:hypothetical protein [Rickettsiales bacterium]